jgi:two-component system, LuxR family, sensor histidine kinase DctS
MSEFSTQILRPVASTRLPRALLVLFLFALGALLVAVAGTVAAQSEKLALADAVRRATEVHALALRGVAARYDYLPFAAARHPDVVAALKEPAMRDRILAANRFLEEVNRRAGSDALYVMDMGGITLAASNWNQMRSFVGEAYGNRPYFLEARDGRSGRFYGVGKTTGEPGLFISTPVKEQDTIIGVIAVKVSLRPIQETWANVRDPVFVSDEKGIVFLSSVGNWTYRTTRDLTSAEIAQVERDEQYGHGWIPQGLPWQVSGNQGEAGYEIETELQGEARHFLAKDEALTDLGWTLTVMADRTSVTQARARAGIVSGLGFALVVMGGLYWQQRERSFREQRDARRELEERVQERTKELLEAHAFRKAMEDSLLVGMRARELDGRIIYVNPALCEMTGFGPDELLGRLPPYPYWHPDDLERHWRDNDAAMSGRAALSGFESRIRHRDGHDVYTMVYTAPLIDSRGQHGGWMSSVVDITEQKRAEARQRQQDEQLQRIARVVTVGEITSTLAHELNQPLAALVNFAATAKSFVEQGQEASLKATLDDISAEAQRAADIVRQVRGLLSQGSEGFKVIAPNEIVARALAFLEPEIRIQRVRVHAALQTGLPSISGDRILLEQVLLNLLVNAIQAMRTVPIRQRALEVATDIEGEGVAIRVADRGTGVDLDAAPRLFDPFFTTKARGLGLGLSICRTIIERHGGRIGFTNRLDGGAEFTIHLPRAP